MRHLFIFFVISLLFFPLFIFAQCGGTNEPPCASTGYIDSTDSTKVGVYATANPESFTVSKVTALMIKIANIISWSIGVIAVMMGLYAGFLFMMASGDAEQVKTASKTFLWAIVGVAVAIFSLSIVAITKALL